MKFTVISAALAALASMASIAFAPTALAQAASAHASSAPALPPASDPANWRKVDPENLLQLTVKRQDIFIELRPDFAPKHVAQVKKITRAGHYDMLPFHRVINDFMAQGGEVSAVYKLSAPYPSIPSEFTFRRNPSKRPIQRIGDPATSRLGYLDGFVVVSQPDAGAPLMADQSVDSWALHCPGIASMARTDDPNSADTQFFLMRQASDFLDKTYTIWGRAVSGLGVIRGIMQGPDSADGRLQPAEADKLTKAQMVADIPEAKRPSVYVQRTDGPAYAAALEAAQTATLETVCSLPPVPAIVEIPPSE